MTDSQDAVVAMVPGSLFAGTLGAARRMASKPSKVLERQHSFVQRRLALKEPYSQP